MTEPFLQDPDVTLLHGDVLDRLRELPDESVDCVITSPPYWGLRDYGTGTWEGGNQDCDHRRPRSRRDGAGRERPDLPNPPASWAERDSRVGGAHVECECGARRVDNQIGLENTPDAYVARMVEVFREVRRVLAAHGTCWINMGDGYAGTGAVPGEGWDGHGGDVGSRASWAKGPDKGIGQKRHHPPGNLKPKDLVGMPWRLAFALQTDGWYLRSDIIWSKPNPMPESVTDRPTKSHEYVFLLAKRPRYWFDQEAVREPHSPDGRRKTVHDHATDRSHPNYDNVGKGNERWPNSGRNIRSVWEIPTQPYPEAHFATYPEELVRRCLLAGCAAEVCRECGKPRERIVELTPEYAALLASGKAWRTDEGKPDAFTNRQPKDHPANVPQKNVTLGWSDCGHGNYRPGDFELIGSPTGERVGDDPSLVTGRAGMNRPRHPNEGRRLITRYEQRRYAEQLQTSPHREQMTVEAGGATTFAHYIRTDRSGARPVPPDLLDAWCERGWLERVSKPEAREGGNYRPGVVLDPFMGSGTTALVARNHGRHAIGIDLRADYLELAARRLQQLSLLAETR